MMIRVGRFGVRESTSNRLSGILLILLGLGLAAYAMPSGLDAASDLSAQQEPAAHGSPEAVVATVLVQPPAPASVSPPPPSSPRVSTPVLVPAHATSQREPSPPPHTIPTDSHALTRELQKELRRVGCYGGVSDGAW